MSALDTAKEIGRMAVTSGLSKEIIELLEKKIALLAEQVTSLETENTDLKKKVTNLEQELNGSRPKGDMATDAVRFLKLLFDQGRALTVSQIASVLGISKGMAEYHRDNLLNAKMVKWPMVVMMGDAEPSLQLATAGRAYLVEHGHAS